MLVARSMFVRVTYPLVMGVNSDANPTFVALRLKGLLKVAVVAVIGVFNDVLVARVVPPVVSVDVVGMGTLLDVVSLNSFVDAVAPATIAVVVR